MKGRPKKTTDVLPDGWESVILHMYLDGASDVEVKAWIHSEIGTFSNDLWDRWLEEEEAFSETIKKGRLLSNAWWERQGRKNLDSPRFNYTGWYMNMKNRFGWKDKTETQHSGEVGMPTLKVEIVKPDESK